MHKGKFHNQSWSIKNENVQGQVSYPFLVQQEREYRRTSFTPSHSVTIMRYFSKITIMRMQIELPSPGATRIRSQKAKFHTLPWCNKNENVEGQVSYPLLVQQE